jgi:hypothetical protein
MVIYNKPLDDRIVVFGQSCVGKTTFATTLKDHKYYCFDALFQWHLIETLGLSIEANFKHIKEICIGDRFVLDGWHLADRNGNYLPEGAAVYVIYAPYQKIIGQYRVPVSNEQEHWPMFIKWYYEVPYEYLPGTRYFLNDGKFIETTRQQYYSFLEQNRQTEDSSGIQGRNLI